jgi:hypothetical protein
MSTTTSVVLAVALNNEERNMATVSSDELRTAQVADETCQRLLLQASKTPIYEPKKDGLIVGVYPVDGSQQVVVPQTWFLESCIWNIIPHQRAIREHIACSKPSAVLSFGCGSPKTFTKPLETATYGRETALRRRRKQTLCSCFSPRGA